MVRLVAAIILFNVQLVYAAECTRNIPGHYIDRFTVNFDGTVFDDKTGLTWMRCDLGVNWNNVTQNCEFDYDEQLLRLPTKLTWQEALEKTREFNISGGLANANDWRLPNIKEIASIQDLGCVTASSTNIGGYDLAIDNDVFLFPGAYYWSSTPARLKLGTSATTPKAWKMNFKVNNFNIEASEINTKQNVRLVRGTSTKF